LFGNLAFREPQSAANRDLMVAEARLMSSFENAEGLHRADLSDAAAYVVTGDQYRTTAVQPVSF
jgi:hypothetical protein